MTQERRAALMLRWYRAIASAYPHEFRNVFGEEMEQTAEDAAEMLWRHHGWLGMARLLFDLATRLPVEYANEMRQDVRYGRSLRSSPGFTLVALLSLTLGIGVATSAYSEMNGFVLRDVPAVAHPDELAAVEGAGGVGAYQRFREHGEMFSGITAYVAPVAFAVAAGGRTERVWGHLVTPSYFATLRVAPQVGRFFGENEREVAVVSDRYWRDRLGGARGVVGSTLRVNGRTCRVVGVGPEDFAGASPLIFGAELWLPVVAGESIAPELADGAMERYDRKIFHVVGRLPRG